jgi:dolichol-phosphate mannosyltransferase
MPLALACPPQPLRRKPLGALSTFTLVGLLGAGVQVLLFSLFTKQFALPPVAAITIAVELTILHNFLWHERLTWRNRATPLLRDRAVRLYRFHLANGLVSLAGNAGVTYLLVQSLKFPPTWSAATAILICWPANFLFADRWVYKTP